MHAGGMGGEEISATAPAWPQLLGALMQDAGAVGGAIWQAPPGGAVRLLCQQGLGETAQDRLQQGWPGYLDALQTAFREGRTVVCHARWESPHGSPADLQLLLAPLGRNGKAPMVVELIVPESQAPQAPHIEQIIQHRLAMLSSPAFETGDRFAAWLQTIHARLDVHETCMALANETRVLTGWDRVSVAVEQAGELRLEAISGWAAFDSRSGAARELQELCERFREGTEATIFGPGGASTAAGWPDWAADSLGRTGAQRLAILRLTTEREPDRPCGALLLERFEARSEDSLSALEPLRLPAATALNHALVHAEALAPPSIRWWKQLERGRRWRIAALAGTVLLVAAAFWPAPLTIRGDGLLEPERTRDVFAGTHGIVARVLVAQGQSVRQGEPLIELRSAELDAERNRLQGELQTVRQQIQDVETLRVDARRAGEGSGSAIELAAKGEELRALQQSLSAQLAIAEQRTAELTLRSPIAGQVLTWDPLPLLADRPVARTDRLLTVADLQGPWVLRMRIPARDLGPVVQAADRGNVKATFVTASAPGAPRRAQLRELAPALESDPELGSVLPALADVASGGVPGIQPGTLAAYRIDCGRRPLAYVWFRRVIDSATAWWRL